MDWKLRHRLWLDSRGFTLAELLVLLAIVGILSTMSVGAFVTYWHAAAVKGGAQELKTLLNQARQLAIAQNTTVCVNQSGTSVQFLTGGCGGTVWTGPGTDGNGWFTLQNSVNVSSTTANVVFDYMGAGTTAGTYTVQNPVDNSTMTVTVALSGRITMP
jgi:prepilin-type N-terminal cleavage/methylation domain-containing protein